MVAVFAFHPGLHAGLGQRDLSALFPVILFFSSFLVNIPMLVFPLGLLVLFSNSPALNGAARPFLDLIPSGILLHLYVLVAAFAYLIFSLVAPRNDAYQHEQEQEQEYAEDEAYRGPESEEANWDLVLLLGAFLFLYTCAKYQREIRAKLPRRLRAPFTLMVRVLWGVGAGQQQPDGGIRPASQQAIQALREIQVQEACDCTVCLESLAPGELAKQLPCKHIFHENCLLPWLAQRQTCPVCRQSVEQQEGGGAAAGEGDEEGWEEWRWLREYFDWASQHFSRLVRATSARVARAVDEYRRDTIPVRATTTAGESRDALLRLPLRELKERARARNISLRGVFEKEQVVDLLLQSAAPPL